MEEDAIVVVAAVADRLLNWRPNDGVTRRIIVNTFAVMIEETLLVVLLLSISPISSATCTTSVLQEEISEQGE